MRTSEINFIRKFGEMIYKIDRYIFFDKIPDGFRTGNKPFDVCLDNGHQIYFLEFKYLLPNRKSFRVKTIFKPHQIRILNQIAKLHEARKTRNPAWAIIKRGKDIYVFHPKELLQESIMLKQYKPYTLEQAARLFCEI